LVGLPSNRKIGTDGRDPVDVLIKAKRRAARDSPKHVPSYQRTQTRVDDR
jgi:hypothetical protein